MNHILDDNTAEWDARVRSEQQREKTLARLGHIGKGAAVLLVLVALAFGFMLRPKQRPAVASPTIAPTKTVAAPSHRGIPLDVSVTPHRPEPDVLARQAQDLAVGLARVWRSGKSEEASETAHSYTVDYERVVGCDLRWIAGQAGPGVWNGTLSLVHALQELTPYVGRAREGQAVVVTAVICPPGGETLQSVRHPTPD
jgi:hypothetical protein